MWYDCYIVESVDSFTVELHGVKLLVAISRVRHCVYMQVHVLTRLSFPFLFPRTTVFIIWFFCITFSFFFRFYFLLFSYSFLLYLTTRTMQRFPAVLSSRVEENSQVVDSNAASSTRVTDIEIDRGVPS